MSATDSGGISIVCAGTRQDGKRCRRMETVSQVPQTIDGETFMVPAEPYTPDHILAAARTLPGWRVVGRLCFCPKCHHQGP